MQLKIFVSEKFQIFSQLPLLLISRQRDNLHIDYVQHAFSKRVLSPLEDLVFRALYIELQKINVIDMVFRQECIESHKFTYYPRLCIQ